MKYLKTYEASLFPDEYPTKEEIIGICKKYGLLNNPYSSIVLEYEDRLLYLHITNDIYYNDIKTFPNTERAFDKRQRQKCGLGKDTPCVEEFTERFYGLKNVFLLKK